MREQHLIPVSIPRVLPSCVPSWHQCMLLIVLVMRAMRRQLPDTFVSHGSFTEERDLGKWQHLQLSSSSDKTDISPWSPKEVTQLPITRKLTLPAQNCCLFLVQLVSSEPHLPVSGDASIQFLHGLREHSMGKTMFQWDTGLLAEHTTLYPNR